VVIGKPDRSLTGASGLVAVAELDAKLAVTATLDEYIGPIKRRDRGLSAGGLLASMASCQLAGGDHLVSLDRHRADVAGQRLTGVARPPSTTAAGLARRFGPAQLAGIETAIGQINARVLGLVPRVRRSALERSVTIDIDATDVEVYGSGKGGVAYNYQGQRCGRADIAYWAELGVPLAADLLAGNDDPRSSVVGLLRRALASARTSVRVALPVTPPDQAGGTTNGGTQVRVRVDAGYFAGDLARECLAQQVEFAIGAKRIAPLWRCLSGIDDGSWVPAIGMDDTDLAVADYIPDWWPADTACIVRRTRLSVEHISADTRSRRRRTVPTGQLALADAGLCDHVFAYSFILTNLDVTTPEHLAEAEYWYRHRTDIEALNKDAKHGAALRHLPSGDAAINTVWMWSALLACATSAWLQEVTGIDRGNGRGRATITRLRRELICVPARIIDHARRLELRLPPGPCLLPTVLHRLRQLPAPT
jgi:hypothetical protein